MLVRAFGDDPALIQDDDPIGPAQRRGAVGDEDGGVPGEHVVERGVDDGLGVAVDRGGGLVEHEDLRANQQHPRQRDALALAARQRRAALADLRVVAVRHRHDHVVDVRGTGRGLDVGVGRARRAQCDVLGDGGREEERLLEHHADVAAERRLRHAPDVLPVDADGPLVGVVGPQEQRDQRRLARTRAADDRDPLPRGDAQRHVVQDRVPVAVGERDVIELDRSIDPGEHRGVGPIGNTRLELEQLEDPLGAGARLLAGREQRGEEPDRRDQLDEVAREREEDAQGQVALEGEPSAEGEHAELGERRQRLQRTRVARRDARGAQPRPEQVAGPVGQEPELALLLGEGLDDPHARDRLVDHTRDGGREDRVVPAGREDPVPVADGEDEEEGDERGHHQAEERRQDGHHDERDHQEGDVVDEQRHLVEVDVDQREVGRRPRHDVARVDRPVVGRPVERVEPVVDPDAQPVLDIGAHAGDERPPDDVEDEGEAAEHDHEDEQGFDRERRGDDRCCRGSASAASGRVPMHSCTRTDSTAAPAMRQRWARSIGPETTEPPEPPALGHPQHDGRDERVVGCGVRRGVGRRLVRSWIPLRSAWPPAHPRAATGSGPMPSSDTAPRPGPRRRRRARARPTGWCGAARGSFPRGGPRPPRAP